jgi:hypothetical protein
VVGRVQVSNIHLLEKEVALEFVKELQDEEEALGDPNKPPARRSSKATKHQVRPGMGWDGMRVAWR